MAYSDDQVAQMLDSLTARVTALDGLGLPAGVKGTVPALTARVNGLKTDISGVNGVLQQQLTKVNVLFTQVTAGIRQVLNLPAGS